MTRPSLPRLAKRLPNAAGGPFLEASRFRLILGGCFLSTTSRPNSGVPGKRFARTAPVWRPGFAFDSIEVVTWARGVRVRELSRYVLGEGAALQRSSQSGRRLSLSRHAARGCVFRYASSIPHEPRATRVLLNRALRAPAVQGEEASPRTPLPAAAFFILRRSVHP